MTFDNTIVICYNSNPYMVSEVGSNGILSDSCQFDFKPEDWPRWIRCFEHFRMASDLASKSEKNQVNTFVYSMGDKADDILQSFNLSENDSSAVKDRFEAHFVKKKKHYYERAKFNQRKQEEGEPADNFITDCTVWQNTANTEPSTIK